MLRAAGCRRAYVDGSFVTSKDAPNDFDACWELEGVAPGLVDPVLLTFDHGRAAQKIKYLGEFFPIQAAHAARGEGMLAVFQVNHHTGERKGIVAIDLQELG